MMRLLFLHLHMLCMCLPQTPSGLAVAHTMRDTECVVTVTWTMLPSRCKHFMVTCADEEYTQIIPYASGVTEYSATFTLDWVDKQVCRIDVWLYCVQYCTT